MNNDSTRKRRVQKTLGLHYSRFYLIARCIDSLFQRKILENRSSAAPVEKVGLTDRRLAHVSALDKYLPVASGALRCSYEHQSDPEAQAITGCLAGFLSAHQLKQFR